MSDSSFDTIIMVNSHDAGEALAVYSDVESSPCIRCVMVYK